MREEELDNAHKHSIFNRAELEASSIAGCFYCSHIFKPSEVTEWIDENEQEIGQTALCPKCGIDSVLGDKSGFIIEEQFLRIMYDHWFGGL